MDVVALLYVPRAGSDEELSVGDSLTATASAKESRVGYALTNYSEVGI